MERLSKIWAGIKVILKAAPTWITTATVLVTTFSDEIVTLLPPEVQEQWQPLAVKILAVLAGASLIIRRVSPVLKWERGILPQTLPLDDTTEGA